MRYNNLIHIHFRNSTSSAPGNTQGTGRRDGKMLKPKMDLGKALATMGFGTARLDDVHGKRDAQDELNVSLTRLMETHEKKKKKLLETEKIEQRRQQMGDKLRDEVRTVHEAYQFLSRKYALDKERLKEKEKEIQEFNENRLDNPEMTTNLIKVELDDNDKKETMDFGAAVALKSAARTFKANKNKAETNKPIFELLQGKLGDDD